jgi:hypothetical protein
MDTYIKISQNTEEPNRIDLDHMYLTEEGELKIIPMDDDFEVDLATVYAVTVFNMLSQNKEMQTMVTDQMEQLLASLQSKETEDAPAN